MPSTTGERQIGRTLDEIAPNHRSRYWFACERIKELDKRGLLPPKLRILDAAAGVGYGSYMIAVSTGRQVLAIDRADEAEIQQRKFFSHPLVEFRKADLETVDFGAEKFAAAVSLETIEHIPDEAWIGKLEGVTNIIVGTVPNQRVVPFDPKKHPWHLRHYTSDEVICLFRRWAVGDWHTQYGKWQRHEMTPGDDGMTLGFVATRIS